MTKTKQTKKQKQVYITIIIIIITEERFRSLHVSEREDFSPQDRTVYYSMDETTVSSKE